MASMWRRAMVYLGLQDDDELDYGGDYEPYGDYGDHHLDDARDGGDGAPSDVPRSLLAASRPAGTPRRPPCAPPATSLPTTRRPTRPRGPAVATTRPVCR